MTQNVFLQPDMAASSDFGSPLPEAEQDPILPLSRLPRLARSPGPREKQATRFSPYACWRRPRASLAVRVDLPHMLSPNNTNTGLPTPISAALRYLENYDDFESEAEVSMICSTDDDDNAKCGDEEHSGDSESGLDVSIASYYFSSEPSSLVDSASTPSTTSDPLVLATPTVPSRDTVAHIHSASLSSMSSDPMLLVTPAEKGSTTNAIDMVPATLPSTGSMYRFPSSLHLSANRYNSACSLSDTLVPYSSWSDCAENDNLPLLYNAVLRGVRAEDLRAIAADAMSEEAAEECVSRVAGELFAYAARVARGEAEEEQKVEGLQSDSGGWWFADAWRAWRAALCEHA